MKDFNPGLNVKSLRMKADLSQTELSDMSGLTCAAISMIEKGGRDMALSTAKKLAEALGVSIDSLANVKPVSGEHVRLEYIRLNVKLQKIREITGD